MIWRNRRTDRRTAEGVPLHGHRGVRPGGRAFRGDPHRRRAGARRPAARAASPPAATSCSQPRCAARARSPGPAGWTSCPRRPTIRAGDWQVAPAPAGPASTAGSRSPGPTERKMTINALNSGAKVWLADLEDANTPHWANVVGGQVNLYDAVRGTASFDQPGRASTTRCAPTRRWPTIVVRPRGWHLDERHLPVDGRPAVGALVDFGLYFFHNAQALLDNGAGPYFYLPKMESHLEARLWNDVFTVAAGGARHPARHDPRDRADRDDPGRVRDGGDPLRAARARVRAQRRPLGLPVQHHQVLPRRRPGVRAARTGRR